jgi:hypothetical protein
VFQIEKFAWTSGEFLDHHTRASSRILAALSRRRRRIGYLAYAPVA